MGIAKRVVIAHVLGPRSALVVVLRVLPLVVPRSRRFRLSLSLVLARSVLVLARPLLFYSGPARRGRQMGRVRC